MSDEVLMTFHNIASGMGVGDLMEIYEGGEKRIYMIVAVYQVGNKTTYWLRLL